MRLPFEPGTLVRMARAKTGLSQRAMARRAETSQSVVARVETGVTDPTGDTLRRLLSAAGFEVLCELEPTSAPDTHMLADVDRILALTPEERLLEVRDINRFVAEASLA